MPKTGPESRIFNQPAVLRSEHLPKQERPIAGFNIDSLNLHCLPRGPQVMTW